MREKKYRIMNIAHMGSVNKTTPPNSLAAFKESIKAGVDAIEFDIQETKDHYFVIYHDSKLPVGNINELSLSQIEKYKSDKDSDIPYRLDEAFRLCKDKVKLMIEIKHIMSISGFLNLLREQVKLSEVMVTSFSNTLIKDLSTLEPSLNTGIVVESDMQHPMLTVISAKAKSLIVNYPLLRARHVMELHSNGILVYVWNIKEEMDLRKVINMNVDGIITDNSILLKSILDSLYAK